MIDFDQITEYVTEGPIIHPVALDQHSLDSPHTLATVVRGYIHTAQLGRAILSGAAELALVFSEWNADAGLPDNPGIVASMVLAPWPAKQIAAAYVIASSALLDQINQQRAVALALIRMAISADDGPHPLAPDEPFTAVQVTALATWLNEHGVTNQEFAALFDVSAAQLATWLQTHPRWQMAWQMHDRFT